MFLILKSRGVGNEILLLQKEFKTKRNFASKYFEIFYRHSSVSLSIFENSCADGKLPHGVFIATCV